MERREPVIEYPCRWEYKIFGRDEGRLREAVAELLAGLTYDLEFSRTSAEGSYLSLTLTLEVADAAERQRIWDLLRGHDEVVYVF